jgi:hypothetical protein
LREQDAERFLGREQLVRELAKQLFEMRASETNSSWPSRSSGR